MGSVGDWAPNWHAVVVHLPVGLLVSALATDLVALARREPGAAGVLATALQTAGAAALLVAYLTGRAAAGEVFAPGLAQGMLHRHWDRALWTVWVVGAATAGRLAVWWTAGAPSRPRLAALALAAAAGVALLTLTADLGGRLVYEHGVGVAAPAGR